MDDNLDKALLKVIQAISKEFGPSAVLKGGMALRLQGVPRSTIDADFSFKPFRKKTPFSKALIELMCKICDDVEHFSDSKKIQLSGKIDGEKVIVEASAHAEDFEPYPLETTFLSDRYDLSSSIISIMPNSMGFSNKLGAWFDRRLARDLYDVYIYYDVLKTEPDRDILMARILKPSFSKLIKNRPSLHSIEAFLDFLKIESQLKGEQQLEEELEGIIEERERKGVGKRILTTINRMVL